MEGDACIHMLKALADETRWRIVRELLEGEMTVGQVTERLNATPYNVSKHVRILREAGIIETRKEGKSVHCVVADAFRQRLTRQKSQLDLGCCTFRFFEPLKSPQASRRSASAPGGNGAERGRIAVATAGRAPRKGPATGPG